MQYIIRAWTDKQGTKYYEFNDLDEAKRMADFFAESFKRHGVEYDVMIYEATKY